MATVTNFFTLKKRFKRYLIGGEAMQTNKAPSGEKILKTLIELYADQMGVKVKYSIKDKEAAPER